MPSSDDRPRRHDRQNSPKRANSITFAIICIYLVACVLIGAAIDARRHAGSAVTATALHLK
jgi:hypothetical protein